MFKITALILSLPKQKWVLNGTRNEAI